MPGSSSWMSYAPQGVKGFDGDDDDDEGSVKLVPSAVKLSIGGLRQIAAP